MSISMFAENPAITIVNTPIIIIKWLNPDLKKRELNRINKYTPAVTKVDECTRAETGVGAAIAAGSQAEKGI